MPKRHRVLIIVYIVIMPRLRGRCMLGQSGEGLPGESLDGIRKDCQESP